MKKNEIISFSLFENIDTGIENKDKTIESLNKLLASTFVLYVKILNFHWNIISKKFYTLHKEFKKLYERTFDDIDLIAERIRSLGGKPISTLKEFLDKSNIKEPESNKLSDEDMISELLKDYESTIKYIRECLNEKPDNATNKILEDLIEILEKDAWMLRSNLKGKEDEEKDD